MTKFSPSTIKLLAEKIKPSTQRSIIYIKFGLDYLLNSSI